MCHAKASRRFRTAYRSREGDVELRASGDSSWPSDDTTGGYRSRSCAPRSRASGPWRAGPARRWSSHAGRHWAVATPAGPQSGG